MACLNLTNGFFIPTNWSTAPSTNVGVVTVTRSATQITVQRAGQTGSVNIFGDFLYAVFGDLGFVALLSRNPGAGSITWTISMVDTTGSSITSSFLFSINLPSSQQPPQLQRSPGNGRLSFFWSGTGTPNVVSNMQIVRSDDHTNVLTGPGTISNLNSNIAAEITATKLIIYHPNTGSNDDTAGPRPAGSLTVTPNSADFGEAVLGASDPTLATVTRTFTLGNSGSDCITVTGIGNDPPFTVAPVSLAMLPIELEPGDTVTIDVIFAPLTPGNNISGSLPVTRDPANGESLLEGEGDARNAMAAIYLSRSSINFGTIPHPGTDTESFTISNSGELDVNVTIPASPPLGSNFTWTPEGLQSLPVSGPTIPVTVTFTTPGDFPAPTVTLTITPTAGSSRNVTLNGAGCIANAVMVTPPSAPINFGNVERGFRTVRFKVVQNTGDGDLTFTARITAGANPAHAVLFGLVLPDSDITDAPAIRTYTVLPTSRCGPGPTGDGTVAVAVSFYANDVASTTPYTAQLEIDDPITATTTTYALSPTITPAVPLDVVLVFDKSPSMGDPVGSRTKKEAANSAGRLLVQMLREDAGDRAAIISFDKDPIADFSIAPVAGNVAAMQAALGFTSSPSGGTNIAGGIIIGQEEYSDPTHPLNPPDLKKAMIVLTDGEENVCFQIGGTGDWYSITGRDDMLRPDLITLQDTEVLSAPTGGINVYGIGLGQAGDIDGAALDALSSATGASYNGVVDLTGKDFFLLEKHFTQIFMEAVGLAPISDPFYTIVSGDKHEHAFNIFPGDVSAMVVIYDYPGERLPIYLISPAGEQISGTSLPSGFGVRFRSTPTARFIEVKFPQGEPKRYDGLWKAVVVHEGRICRGDINPPDDQDKDYPNGGNSQDVGPGFLPKDCHETKDPVDYGIAIGSGSNLRMQAYVEPGLKFVGDTIRLNGVLAEAGLPIKGSNVRVFAESPSGTEYIIILHDDGLHQDGDEDNGDYGGLFTNTTETGVYRFLFRAEGLQAGRPYVRELHRTKTIYDRRKPPRVGHPDGDDCCRKLIRLLKERKPNRKEERKSK